MEITSLAGIVAGIVSLVAFIPYILSILRGETTPSRVTWFVLTLVGVMLAKSYYSSGAEHTIWVPISYIIGPLAIAVLSIKYGEGGWSGFDQICLIGVFSSLILWWFFQEPLIALLINLLIDFLGLLPTVRKSLQRPWSEDAFAWALTCLSSVVNLFAVEEWSFSIAVYPVYMFVGSGIIAGLIMIGQDLKKGGKTI